MAHPETPLRLRGIHDRYLPAIRGVIGDFKTIAASGQTNPATIQSGWELFAQFDALIAGAKGLEKTPNSNIREVLKSFKIGNTHQPSIIIACEQLRFATAESDQEEPGVLLYGLEGQQLANAIHFCRVMERSVI